MTKRHALKRDHDKLTPMEAALVRERKKDPEAPSHEIAKRAGFTGSLRKLRTRYSEVTRRPHVAAALFAATELPRPKPGEPPLTDEQIKEMVRRNWVSIVKNPKATHSDQIKAGDKLMATVKGGYVPVEFKGEIDHSLEGWVRAMGGAPDQQALPAAGREDMDA